MKRIAYLIIDSGVDGLDRPHIKSAFWDEKERDDAFNSDPYKSWLQTSDRIVDVQEATGEVFAGLDGLQRLLLGVTADTLPVFQKE